MWEMVIGLETHVELSAKTKLFCSCSTRFGSDPNTHCCHICTGQPGSLPVMNKAVVQLAATAGIVLNCTINKHSQMARKHYFYPDLPKAYQITQYDKPLCEHGSMELSGGRGIRITRIHIEEDAGKLVHMGGAVLIDNNRGGVPLIEIVTAPDFRSAEEVVEYLETLQNSLRAAGVSDCRMQEGSLRCDVNISLRRQGSDALGIRTEVKNMNSFTAVAEAIEYEYNRHKRLLDSGGPLVQETRGWDAEYGETVSLREKDDAEDYRYMPEPDIFDIFISDDEIAQLRDAIPELPDKKFKRYVNELGILPADAKLLTKYARVSEYFEEASEGLKEPKTVASLMVTRMFSRITTEVQRENWSPKTTARQIGELAQMCESGKLSHNLAKRVFTQMIEKGHDAGDFITADDLEQFSAQALSALCREIVEQNEKTVSDYRAGKEKAIKALVGAVMKSSKGRADAKTAENLLKEMLK